MLTSQYGSLAKRTAAMHLQVGGEVQADYVVGITPAGRNEDPVPRAHHCSGVVIERKIVKAGNGLYLPQVNISELNPGFTAQYTGIPAPSKPVFALFRGLWTLNDKGVAVVGERKLICVPIPTKFHDDILWGRDYCARELLAYYRCKTLAQLFSEANTSAFTLAV